MIQALAKLNKNIQGNKWTNSPVSASTKASTKKKEDEQTQVPHNSHVKG